MGKLKVAAFILLCLFLAACGNEFARREYGSNEKIAQMADHTIMRRKARLAGLLTEGTPLPFPNLMAVRRCGMKQYRKTKIWNWTFHFIYQKGRRK